MASIDLSKNSNDVKLIVTDPDVNGESYLVTSGGASASFEKNNIPGSGVINSSISISSNKRLVSVTAHLSSAPTSSGVFSLTLDAFAGAVYDTLLYSVSMIGVTSLLYQPDSDLVFEDGDALVVAYTNPDSRTCGIQVTFEGV